MATADELLSLMSTDGDDKTLVIDNYLRKITIPKGITCLGVEYDDDVLQLDFKMPRYFGDIDLSKFSIRVNYLNAQGEGDVYTVKNPTVNSSSILFTWLVGPTATTYKGDTKFNVCLKLMTADGYIDKEYNTTIATLPVLEGLETDERVVAEYTDILEQWKRELFGIGDTEEASIRNASQKEQENIAQKGAEVLATIPEDYQKIAEATQEGIRTKADAIVCSAQGEGISISDSSDDHVRNLRIFGKTTQATTTGAQLIPQPYSDGKATINGVRFTVNADGSIAASGTSTAGINYYLARAMTLTSGTYTFSKAGDLIGGRLYIYDFTESVLLASLDENVDSTTFTTEKDYTNIGIYINTAYEGKVFGGMVYPMLNKGDSALPYEQYTGAVASPNPDHPQDLVSVNNSKIIISGKNLWSPTNDYDASGTYWSWKVKHSNEKMTITLIDKDTSVDLSGIYFGVTGVGAEPTMGYRWLVSKGTVYLTTYTTEYNYISVYPNNADTLDKLSRRFYIMVELGEEYTSYEDPRYEMSMNIDRALNGIPVTSGGNYTDENGQQWICDEIDYERGVYIQRINEYAMNGSEHWAVSGIQSGMKEGFTRYDGTATAPASADTVSLWTHFSYKGTHVPDGYGAWVYGANGSRVGVRVVTQHDSVDALEEYLAALYEAGTPVKVQYILATPIETPLTAEELEAFKALKTNYPHTTVLNDAGAHMELSYNADTKTYVDNGIKQTVTDVLEAIENGSY